MAPLLKKPLGKHHLACEQPMFHVTVISLQSVSALHVLRVYQDKYKSKYTLASSAQ